MSPILHSDLIIQGNAIDGIAAYSQRHGALVWKLNVENGVEGGAQVVDGRLYFGASDGQFYSVMADTGRVLWTFPVRAETLAPPTVHEGSVYFQSGADLVFAVDAATGRQRWLYNRQSTTALSIRSTTRPQIDENTVYVGFSDGFLVALSRQTGAMLWEKKLSRNLRFQDIDATPVVDGNMIYVSSYDGSLFALNKTSGEVLWQIDQGGYTPVTVHKDLLYFATTGGQVLALDKTTGRVIWTYTLKSGIATQPVIFGGYVLFGESQGAVVVAEARSGVVLTQFSPGHGLMAAPVVHEKSRHVYFISNGANLFALELKQIRPGDRLPWQEDSRARAMR